MAEKKTKRKGLIAALAVLVVALAVGGTVAWLTAQDALSNEFVVASGNAPSKEPDTDQGNDEDKNPSIEDNTVGAYLFETNWKDKSKIVSGQPVSKNPNVGLGEGSEPSYIFIYVDNNMLDEDGGGTLANDAPYFTLEKQWAPVYSNELNQADESISGTTQLGTTAYTSGLFMYVADNADFTWKSLPVALGSSDNPGEIDEEDGTIAKDLYTGELFAQVTMPNGANIALKYADNPTMDVYAFIYGADTNAEGSADGTAQAAINAAIAWASKIEKGELEVSDAQIRN